MLKEWEVVVIGAGAAGLSAALAAAQSGAQVTVLDAYPAPGGQYYRQPPQYLQKHATRRQRQGRQLWQQAQQAGVTIINDCLVWYADGERQIIARTALDSYEVHAHALILASGAYERPVAFPGWTLPGVLMTSAAQTLLYQHILPGKRVLLAGTGPLQLVVAKKLLDAGAELAGVLEGNPVARRAVRHIPALWGQWERIAEGLASYLTMLWHQAPYRTGWGIVEAHGVSQVEGATIARLDDQWRPIPGSHQRVACDTICIGYGLIPFNSLSRQMGAEQSWNEALGGIVPVRDDNLQTSIAGVYAAGDGAGIGGVRMSMIEGRIAGFCAAAGLGHAPQTLALQQAKKQQKSEAVFQRLLMDLFTPGPGAYELASDETLICRCEGVTKRKLAQAVAHKASTMMELKSETRCGMGECQGRICEQGVLHYLEQVSRQPVDASSVYHLRPPVFPLPIDVLGRTPLV